MRSIVRLWGIGSCVNSWQAEITGHGGRRGSWSGCLRRQALLNQTELALNGASDLAAHERFEQSPPALQDASSLRLEALSDAPAP
jgi:hypothetical protein